MLKDIAKIVNGQIGQSLWILANFSGGKTSGKICPTQVRATSATFARVSAQAAYRLLFSLALYMYLIEGL
jgi:hypothetical protein